MAARRGAPHVSVHSGTPARRIEVGMMGELARKGLDWAEMEEVNNGSTRTRMTSRPFDDIKTRARAGDHSARRTLPTMSGHDLGKERRTQLEENLHKGGEFQMG